MNSRSHKSLLISFALLSGFVFSGLSSARGASAMDSFTSPLSAHRSSAVDASGRTASSLTSNSASSTTPVRVARAEPLATAPARSLTAPAEAPAYVVLSREQLISYLKEQLSEHFNVEGDLDVELVRPWVEPAPASEAIVLSVTEFPAKLASNVLVRIKAEAGATLVSDATLSLRVQVWRDSWVVRTPVSRDDSFDPSSLETRRLDVLKERDTIPVSAGDKNLSYTHNVAAGRVLTWHDVTRRPLVRKGELVEVAATEGNLSINMRALALQNGASGDVILVRNIDSKKEISAQVTAEKRVQVRF